MTLLSTIITPSNVLTTENTPDALTADNTKTVTNKTISGASNTITNLNASNLSSGTVATARLASGTANSTTYLRGDQTWAAAGLQYFTESENTSSPNNVIPVDALIVANAGTNVDVALSPKGTGAILAQIPDGTAVGGNKRGANAVDWQINRGSSFNAATGSFSVISGGSSNAVSNSYATVVGGSNSTASNPYATAGGYSADATQTGSVAFGYNPLADGLYGTAVGYNADNRGRPSSLTIGGYNRGDSGHPFQTNIQNVSAETTDATPTVLTGYSSASYTYQNRMDTNSAYAFKIMLIAGVTNAGATKAWELTGCIKRGPIIAVLVGSVTKTVIAADTGAATWDCDIVIDTDAFTVQVTGQAATTIRWTASIYTAEMEY